MRDDDCARVRELLIDAQGGTDALGPEVRRHLETCGACSGLMDLLGSLAPRRPASAPDFEAADRAITRAQGIVNRRKAAGELAGFLGAAIVATAALTTAGALGYGLTVAAFQGLTFLVLPFAALALLRKRAKEESS